MSEQKFSLEDILDEYSPDNDSPKSSVGRVDAQKIINSTIEDPSRIKPEPKIAYVIEETVSHFEGARRSSVPVNDFKPADLSKNKVSVVNPASVNEVKPQASGNTSPIVLPEAPPPGEAPKIRRMSDSTRAREKEKRLKKRRKHESVDSAYERERADGEYMYTPPSFKKKKRTREAIIAEYDSPEGRKHITDIVPSPDAVEAAKPVNPTPRAEVTSINLSERPEYDASAIDVHITQETDEFIAVKTRNKRTKRIVDFNYYGDVEDVGRDIYELKSTISMRVFILAMTAFLSVFVTIGNQFSLPLPNLLQKSNTKFYVLFHLIIGLLSISSSIAVLTKGLKKLFTFKADSDSMTAVTVISCLAALIPAFAKPELVADNSIHIYMPVGILALLINSIAKLLIIRRAARNFKFISKNFDRHGVVYVRDEERAERFTRGTLGDFPILTTTKKTDFLTDFLRYTYSSDMSDAFCKKAAPICLLFSLLVSVVLTMFHKGSVMNMESAAFGLSIFSMMICASSCIAMPFVVNIPLENAAVSSFKDKGIMLGYQSVDDFYDTNSILVNADSLFPDGTVKLAGIKVFSNTKIDEALLEAASLTCHAGSMMRQIFKDVTGGREDMLYPIENYSFEESMGMCGWINNKRVLFGNRELMTSHNIEGIPTRTKESESIGANQEVMYLSISGNLAAMFIVDIAADKQVKKWASKLAKNKICMIIKSIDPCITPKLLRNLFGIPEEMIRIIPKKLHPEFDEETKKSVRLSASMATTGRFTSLAHLIIGTKAVHSAAIIGLIIQTVSILLGLSICMLLIISRAFTTDYIYTSATALIIYNLISTAFTYLAVSIKKS
ncbi:MAG: hypothetical protein IJ487_00435 [Ruminococcus sp.]|nr:hypothetical protein [Ruminococcus sp.]